MTDLASDISGIPLFDGLTEAQLAELAAGAEEVEIEPGTVYFAEGEPAAYWWVLLDGALDLVRHIGREDVVVGRMDVPGRWAGGMQAWDPHGTYLATGRGAVPGRALRLASPVLREKVSAWFPLGMHLISGLYGTARSIESNARQRDSLVTLGTLAAGLAHELNNPAAAASRGVDAMAKTCDGLVDVARRARAGAAHRRAGAGAGGSASRSARPAPGHRRPAARGPRGGGRRAARRARRRRCLEPRAGARRPGGGRAMGRRAAAQLPAQALTPALHWVAGMLSMTSVLAEVGDATHRISELVSSVRSYTQMDRASAQRIRVTEGLDSTLVMLGHKTRQGVEVVKEYAADLPEVEGLPGELNQVWTNLLDNALDAVAGAAGARVRIRALRRRPGRRRRDPRQRPRHAARGRRPRVRRVLHDQGGRLGHGPRPRHRPAHRRRAAPGRDRHRARR